jgi:hypothetical protein
VAVISRGTSMHHVKDLTGIYADVPCWIELLYPRKTRQCRRNQERRLWELTRFRAVPYQLHLQTVGVAGEIQEDNGFSDSCLHLLDQKLVSQYHLVGPSKSETQCCTGPSASSPLSSVENRFVSKSIA